MDPRNVVVRKTATPTITAGAYAAGDAVGGLLTFSAVNGFTGKPIVIESAIITDKGDQNATLNLLLFDRTFTADADNAVFDPEDADLPNIVGLIVWAVADYGNWTDNCAGFKHNLNMAVLPNGTDLFGQLYIPTGGSTPTYASTSDLSVILTIRQLG